MPVYEYECKKCETIIEVQQKMADDPLTECPECKGPVNKIMSMNSFQLKGGGWYADGYSSKSESKKADKPAPPCQTGGGCAGCPASASQ